MFADIASYSREHNVNYQVLAHGMKDQRLLTLVRSWCPDIFIVAGWYHMVPKSWRELAPAYGLHASLLPDYSGGAPLVWAMIKGEKKTGITLFKMADGVDDGPILGQLETEIFFDDTIKTLYNRIENLGFDLLEKHVPLMANRTAVLKPQNELYRRVYPQRGPDDGQIDWLWSSHRIYDFIRAQTKPYPGAFTLFKNRKVTIWASKPAIDIGISLLPGQFMIQYQRIFVGCGESTLAEITQLAVNGVDVPIDEWRQSCLGLEDGGEFV